ncbi:Prp19-domain-containing protein [Yamadazyma tenuis]|uniref:Pre-mRNA-processing factor 19 n=1 Tax=Candida tenuis (strain ATCC 10573 / BCRC 21748 / CBS 615 / JCM 9827 / NBRC 10315 / NRRL Y-1498 / VKM Y-70) TaxID=590646 RepID=G3B0X5_CANTC|nr:uncharacterized protein CANTEDRAFT_120859 [Yamadazyma tenuis ATCC 10573]EGV64832.1 hypothetical protein CANTEDRAFT_120859 [Yamadazyma tenuis ATCC 10573]WEJ97623.1 Prp19-domain-containing protein [Yamadazyma tenuis]
MFCALSGEVAKEPVLSPRSGKIFDRKLITTYVSTNNKDPITDEPLGVEELIAINVEDRTVVPPKPPSFNSIPSLLTTFQNEFDSMALEIFSLRKSLHKARQELSSALYNYDAAVKVAANAIKERDDVKTALQELTLSIGNDAMGEEDHENGSNGLDVAVPVQEIEAARQELFQQHKTQKVSLPAADDVSIIFEGDVSIKKYNAFFFDERVQKLLVSSGKETTTLDLVTKTNTVATQKGVVQHVSYIEFEGLVVPVFASKKQIKFEGITIKFRDEIVDIQPHPKLKNIYAVVCTKSWSLNVGDKKCLFVQLDNEYTATTGSFHVDGALMAIGTTSGTVLVYGVADGSVASTLEIKYPTVDKVQFGLNGYWLFVSSSDKSAHSLQVFDLRNHSVVHTIDFEELNDFAIDQSCSLLLTCNSKEISFHKYTKKGKTWNDFFKSVEVESTRNLVITKFENGVIHGVQLGDSIKNFKIEFN